MKRATSIAEIIAELHLAREELHAAQSWCFSESADACNRQLEHLQEAKRRIEKALKKF